MNDKITGIPVLRPFLGVLLSAWFLFSCGQDAAEEEKKDDTEAAPAAGNLVNLTEGQYRNAGIELGKMERRTLSHYLTVNGVLDVPPENLVSISAPMGGFLKSTHLLPGSRVKKGQTIAVIEHPDYIQLQQDYLDSKSRLTFAALEYQRQGELNQEHVNSAKAFQQSTADYQVLQHRVKSLEEKLRLIGLNPAQLRSDRISRSIPIRTPISGYVKTVNVNLGKYVHPSDVLFDIVDTRHMHLALSVFERDIPRVREKQKVLFHLPSEPEKVRIGSVHLVGKALEADKTVMVHVHLNQDDPTLLPGMYVNARIETGDSTAYTLPNGAIVHSEGTYVIFVPVQGPAHTYERVPVTKGGSENGYTAVSLPAEVIPHQTPVVVKGAYALLSKMTNVEEED
jgi:cobalt-zinc-cadmium efflux system membrane fusion protein